MTPRDVPFVGGENLGVGGDIGVGEQGPTPHTRHDDAARRHWVEVSNPRDTFHEGGGGWNFLKKARRPLTPGSFCFANAAGDPDSLPHLHSAGVEQQLKFFCDNFFVAAAPRLHHLVPPHLTIPCFHKPPKHNVAIPINKVEGRLGGANPVGGRVGVAHHPMRGYRKGFSAEGGFTQNEGGGAHEAPRYHCKEVVL